MAAFAREVLDPSAPRLVVRSFGRAHASERTDGSCADTACVASRLPEVWSRAEP
jgi:hypothetical protein